MSATAKLNGVPTLVQASQHLGANQPYYNCLNNAKANITVWCGALTRLNQTREVLQLTSVACSTWSAKNIAAIAEKAKAILKETQEFEKAINKSIKNCTNCVTTLQNQVPQNEFKTTDGKSIKEEDFIAATIEHMSSILAQLNPLSSRYALRNGDVAKDLAKAPFNTNTGLMGYIFGSSAPSTTLEESSSETIDRTHLEVDPRDLLIQDCEAQLTEIQTYIQEKKNLASETLSQFQAMSLKEAPKTAAAEVKAEGTAE